MRNRDEHGRNRDELKRKRYGANARSTIPNAVPPNMRKLVEHRRKRDEHKRKRDETKSRSIYNAECGDSEHVKPRRAPTKAGYVSTNESEMRRNRDLYTMPNAVIPNMRN